MQSKTTRGVRHLLVSAGVISLVLSAAAPAALAKQPDEDRKHWVCHATGSTTNPWEFNHVSLDAGGVVDGVVPDQELFDRFKNKSALTKALADEDAGAELEGDLIEACDVEALASEGGASGGTAGGGEGAGNGDGVPGGGNENAGGNSDGVPGGGNENAGGNSDGVPGGGNDHNPTERDSKNDGGGDEVTVVNDPPVDSEQPAEAPIVDAPVVETPAQPIPPAQPRPVVNISNDAVTRPVTPATPVAAPAAGPKADNEVLGAITTRTPTPGVGALDPGAHTTGSITALAATGADGTSALAAAGAILLLAGFGLQVSARRRMRAADIRA